MAYPPQTDSGPHDPNRRFSQQIHPIQELYPSLDHVSPQAQYNHLPGYNGLNQTPRFDPEAQLYANPIATGGHYIQTIPQSKFTRFLNIF